MLCRVAESLYWMARYVERAENVARFIDVNLNLALDAPSDFNESQQWMSLVTSSGDGKTFLENYYTANASTVINFLSFDTSNPNSILSCLTAARENARSVRDIISSEMWEQLNHLYLNVKDVAKAGVSEDEIQFFREVKQGSHLFVGLAEATMSHGEGWHFARLGRLLERADKTARILDVRYFMLLPSPDYIDTPFDGVILSTILKSTSAFEMYRKKYQGLTRQNVVDFLILDKQFPRALRYCLDQSLYSLEKIMGEEFKPNDVTEELGILKNIISKQSSRTLVEDKVHELIDIFQAHLNKVDVSIRGQFFDLASPVSSFRASSSCWQNGLVSGNLGRFKDPLSYGKKEARVG